MISWHIVTREEFDKGTPDPEHIYYISDTKEIYRGDISFTGSVEIYNGVLPDTLAINKLYINSINLEGKIYDSVSQKIITVIKPLGPVDKDNTSRPVSGQAVYDFVLEEIKKYKDEDITIASLEWDDVEKILKATKTNENVQEITFSGIGVKLEYNKDTNELSLLDRNDNLLGDKILIDISTDKYITNATFDSINKQVHLIYNTEENDIIIDLSVLLDESNFEDSESIYFTKSNNIVSGNIKISTKEGNIIKLTDDGIYAIPDSDGTKMDKIELGSPNQVLLSNDNGNAILSGVSIGGSSIKEIPDVYTLATELAIKNAIQSIRILFDKEKHDELLMVGKDGYIEPSGMKSGNEIFNTTPDSNTLATELGVVNYIKGSEVLTGDDIIQSTVDLDEVNPATDKVISEIVFVDKLEWQELKI